MARDFTRIDRLAEVIQQDIAQLIQREIKDPRLGLVTILAVKLSKDLAYAKIYVSVLSEEKAQESIDTLNRAAGFLRGLLAKKLKLRVMPALQFIYDDITIRANRLNKLIDEACRSNKPHLS